MTVSGILDALEAKGELDNTYIVFTSDNGAEQVAVRQGRLPNGYFRGAKNTLYEGGIRVPCIFSWKGQLPAGKTEESTIMSMDLFPTFLNLGGGDFYPEQVDGTDLWPLFSNGEPLAERKLYWSNTGKSATRQGDWKLVRLKDKVELFNLAEDPDEMNDLSGNPEYRDRLNTMFSDIDQWWLEVTMDTPLEGKDIENKNLR